MSILLESIKSNTDATPTLSQLRRPSRDSSINFYPIAPEVELYERNGGSWRTVTLAASDLLTYDFKGASVVFVSLRSLDADDFRQQFSNHWKVPPVYWTAKSKKSSGYFGCGDDFDGTGKITGHSTWLNFHILQAHVAEKYKLSSQYPLQYHWDKIRLFTRWTPAKYDVLFCFDAPTEFREAIKTSVSSSYPSSQVAVDPYTMHSIVLEEVIDHFNTSVWSIRDLVRGFEKNRPSADNPEPNYQNLHDLARQTIHSSETLESALGNIIALVEQHDELIQYLDSSNVLDKAIFRRVKQTINHEHSLLRCLKLRSDTLRNRLNNEINLAFNVVAQHDSRTAVEIGQAAKDDSSSMKTIAVLTLVFLPGTAISVSSF
jgi:hypothetical protein